MIPPSEMKSLFAVLGLLSSVLLTTAAPNCPPFGYEYPQPKNLTSHPAWQAAIQNLTSTFDYIDANVAENFSYSIQVFSTIPGEETLFERYFTSPKLSSQNSDCAQKVDENTVYRIGSLTKVFTVLTFLAEAGDIHWKDPITKYIPELSAMAKKFDATGTGAGDFVSSVNWDDVTLEGLASQMTGMQRDCRRSLFKSSKENEKRMLT
jgi:hypothetical protein